MSFSRGVSNETQFNLFKDFFEIVLLHVVTQMFKFTKKFQNTDTFSWRGCFHLYWSNLDRSTFSEWLISIHFLLWKLTFFFALILAPFIRQRTFQGRHWQTLNTSAPKHAFLRIHKFSNGISWAVSLDHVQSTDAKTYRFGFPDVFVEQFGPQVRQILSMAGHILEIGRMKNIVEHEVCRYDFPPVPHTGQRVFRLIQKQAF